MIQFPDHVCKTLLMKIGEAEAIDKEIFKSMHHLLNLFHEQSAKIAEIKGVLQAEEYESQERKRD